MKDIELNLREKNMIPVGFEPTSSFEPSFVQRRLIKLGYGNMLFESALETYFSLSFYIRKTEYIGIVIDKKGNING